MDALQRQGYLKAMGVDCFVPRLILPGAALSKQTLLPVYHLNELAENLFEDSPLILTQPGMPSSIESLITATGLAAKSFQEIAEIKPPIEPAPEVNTLLSNTSGSNSSKSTDKNAAKVPSFQLTISIYASGIMVISAMQQASIGHQLFCRSLLNEIIQAFRLDNKLLLEPEVFSWPMVQSVQIDQSAEIAVETLRATVAAKTNKFGVKMVLLFGSDAARYLLNGEEFMAAIGKQFALARLPPILVTHSLSQLLQTPVLKKATLQHLLPLFDFAQRF